MKNLIKKITFITRLFSSSELKFCVLLLTNKCNLRCDYCSIPNYLIKEMSKEEWYQAINKLEQFGVVHYNILGGEPLLRSDLLDIVKYISDKGMGVTLTTNGVILTKNLILLLSKAGLFMLIISLDYMDRSLIKGNYDQAISKLKYAADLGIIPVIHSVITSNNIDTIPILAREVTQKGIFYSCSLYQSVNGNQSNKVDSLTPEKTKVLEIFQELKKIKKKTGLIKTSNEYIDNYRFYSKKGWKCNQNHTKWICIQSDGHLMICAEWQTGLAISDVNRIPNNRWNEIRTSLIEDCPGCYYECYYSEDRLSSIMSFIKEVPKKKIFWDFAGKLLIKNILNKY